MIACVDGGVLCVPLAILAGAGALGLASQSRVVRWAVMRPPGLGHLIGLAVAYRGARRIGSKGGGQESRRECLALAWSVVRDFRRKGWHLWFEDDGDEDE